MRKELEKGMELVTQDLVYQTKGFILYIIGSRALLTSSAGKYIRILSLERILVSIFKTSPRVFQ